MKIDLHIHTSTGSDGALTVEDVFAEAARRGISLMSVTDHDSVDSQPCAMSLAGDYGISYITGVELNVTFDYPGGRPVSLDFLGYQFDIENQPLQDKLLLLRKHRQARARQILKRLNAALDRDGIPPLTAGDFKNIEDTVDGAFGRPHIARYLVEKGIVQTGQEAFDRYLIECDVPKYPLSLAEASSLLHNAGGVIVLAHPADAGGTSLAAVTADLYGQTGIIARYMLGRIDGIECWHPGNDQQTTNHYIRFAGEHGLIATGGSDCHQKPVLIGCLDIPGYVAGQFGGPRRRHKD